LMPTVAETLIAFSQRVDRNKSASWDRHGLQIGDPAAPAGRIGVCHEVTEEVVGLAIAAGLGLLITYHPLIFQPLERVVSGGGPGGRVFRLLGAGVAVATFHTAWDVARGGAADALAAALGLQNPTGFAPLEPAPRIKFVTFVPPEQVDEVAGSLSAIGAGQIGNYDGCAFRSEGIGTFVPGPGAKPVVGATGSLNHEKEVRLEMIADKRLEPALVSALTASHPYEEPAFDIYDIRANLGMAGRVGDLAAPLTATALARLVENALASTPRVAYARDLPVARVAVVPGAGGFLATAAAETGAQVLITGDVSHHQTIGALDLGLGVLDPGHAATERPGISAMLEMVAAVAPDVVDLTTDPTPWARQ
jgi:dinuclear metal center YbgI/SA1388 family protein